MSETYLGDMRALSFDFAPKGWAQCRGQLMPVSQNQALFSLLGTTYGGDPTRFALPNPPPVPAQGGGTLTYCICINGRYPMH